VEGVTVTALSEAGTKHSAVTDSSGIFTIKELLPAQYALSASRSGFLPFDSSEHSTSISIALGQKLEGLQISLTPTAAISGTVFDESHMPVINAVVMAIQPTFVNGRRVLVPDGASNRFFLPMGSKWGVQSPKAVTDEHGQYRIFGLAPGKYYVSVWNAGGETLEEASRAFNAKSYTKDQPPEYFPGVVDPEDAIPIDVNGLERQGMDLEVHQHTLHNFSFKAVSPAIAPYDCSGSLESMRDVKAFVLIRHTQNVDVIQYASRFGNSIFRKGDDNKWTSPPLPPGSYQLFYNSCMFSAFGLVGTLEVNIADHDVDAGTIVVPINVGISGHIRKTEAASVIFSNLRVRLRPLDLRSANASSVPNPVAVNGDIPVASDGAFTFNFRFSDTFPSVGTSAPGLYQIDLSGLPPDAYVESIKVGGQEVRDNGFRIDSDGPGPVEITLSQSGGIVDGIVKGRSGKPTADSLVLLVPSNPDLVYSNLFKSTRTNQDGTFYFRGIPPSEYGVLALDNLETGAERSREFRDEFESRILKVIVKEGSSINVTLQQNSR
jgi:hypothetical protein